MRLFKILSIAPLSAQFILSFSGGDNASLVHAFVYRPSMPKEKIYKISTMSESTNAIVGTVDLDLIESRTMTFSSTMSAPMELGNLMFRVQRAGENIFAAMLCVAFVQASIALVQYRTNPRGQLMIPPGLTIGLANPQTAKNQRQPQTTIQESIRTFAPPLDSQSYRISTGTSQYARVLNRLNRWLVLLIPWASQKLGWILQRNTHLFHLGFIMSLAGLFDIPNRWIIEWEDRESSPTNSTKKKQNEDVISIPHTLAPKMIERIIVIGDSLAVGLGSVNAFDSSKINSAPFCRIENVDVDTTNENLPGPIFPRALAETLANHYHTKVHWRSAGVDGGDTALIQEYCLDLIKQEADEGRTPDAVVVLCGTNDLKYFVSNPFLAPGPRTFRQRLKHLLQEIQAVAPHTKIILPMFPTQMFRASSPLNIFPLNFFLDAVVGFWDSQKKLVADRYPSDNVVYLGLRPSEIYDWYKNVEDDDYEKKWLMQQSVVPTSSHEDGLIAADGIHPSAKCYTLWAKFLGDQLVSPQSPANP